MAATIQQIVKPTRARGLDTSGNNNHAQIYSGRALEFDGAVDSLTVPDNVLEGEDWRTGTTAFWVYLRESPDASDRIFSSYTNSTTRFYVLLNSGGKIGHRFGDEGSDTFSNLEMPLKTWHRVVIAWNVDGTANIYINGVLDKASTGIGVSTLNAISMGGANNFSIGSHNGASAFFSGMLSDFQMWNSTWTAEDAEYDYLNPEQLALNRGGTSLTNSNLKLWYPMNEGHRGDQSYVLDASNTGICDNIVDSGITGGTTKDGWVDFDTGDTQVTVDSDLNAIKYTYLDSTSGMYTYLRDSYILTKDLTVGNVYKISYKVKVSDSSFNVNFKVQGGSVTGAPQGGATNSTEFVEQSFNILATDATGHYIFSALTGTLVSGQSTVWLKDFKVEPINDKHNATTVFYGDDLFDSGVGDYGDSTGAWVAEGNNTIANDTSALKITYVDDDDGAKLFLKDSADLTTDLTVGRRYRLTFTYKVNKNDGGDLRAQINQGDGTFQTTGILSQTSFTTITKDFTAMHATNANFRFNQMDSGDILHIKDVSLKEIGIASGWTDADQQLDIPQTALQSYNQLAWNHNPAPSNHPIGTVAYSPNFGTDSFVVSFSMFPNVAEDARFMFQNESGSDGRFVFYYENTKELEIYVDSESSTSYLDITGTILEPGQWHHIIAVFNRTAGTVTAYVNGEAQSQSADISSVTGTINGGGQFLPYSFSNTDDFQGCLTEIAFWKNTTFSDSDANELYNEGLILDAREHSKSSTLINYWKNNGLAEWEDLVGSNNLKNNNMTETMLITAGVDSSRDSQGFFMNRQRTANSLNLNNLHGSSVDSPTSYVLVKDSPSFDHVDTSKSYFSISLWYKRANLSDEGVLFAKYDTNSKREFNIEMRGDGAFEMQYGANSGAGYNRIKARTGAQDDTDWHHIGFVYNGNSSDPETPEAWASDATGRFQMNGRVRVWIDGTEIADGADEWQWTAGTSGHEAVPPAQITELSSDVSIGNILATGAPYNSDAYWFDGQIDDVLFYSKSLSEDEIKRNYKAGKRSHK